jgi:protoporphyrinogen/coproporphyrinogen III oxidase
MRWINKFEMQSRHDKLYTADRASRSGKLRSRISMWRAVWVVPAESSMARFVIVIGAGIAGLSAAHQLSNHGFDVTVLEAADRLGGRMSTDVRDAYRIDRGAQFLSTGYATIGALIARLGLASQLSTPSAWCGTTRAGRVRRTSARQPWTAATSGLLAWRDLLRLGVLATVDAHRARHLPLNDYAAWHEWDDQDAADWISRRFGPDVLEYVFEPMLEGFYFQAPERSSRALPLLLWSFGARRSETIALRLGMGQMVEALARDLDVRLATPVLALACSGEGVRAETAQGIIHADHVVLATTASAARHLYKVDCAITQTLLGTEYSSTINIGIAVPGGIEGSKVPDDVYGLLIPRRERKVIAAVGIESRKSPDLVPRGELLNVMLGGDAGARLIGASENAVLAEVLPELERYFPNVGKRMAFAHFCRWHEAEPRSAVGRARAIAAYRKSCSPSQKIVLAGDYLSIPTTEGAALSGIWAADLLLAGKD